MIIVPGTICTAGIMPSIARPQSIEITLMLLPALPSTKHISQIHVQQIGAQSIPPTESGRARTSLARSNQDEAAPGRMHENHGDNELALRRRPVLQEDS